uniref:Uncharacterized protein n=1 Tax=Anguilla anguilla TaxID=7936 RepID=A0A0E9XN94_ANGAN
MYSQLRTLHTARSVFLVRSGQHVKSILQTVFQPYCGSVFRCSTLVWPVSFHCFCCRRTSEKLCLFFF